MLLAIDIGNSAIKFGIYDASGLLHRFSVATWRDYSPEELFFERFRYVEQRFVRINAIIASSVVPEVDDTLVRASLEFFKVTPVFVDETFDLGISIHYDPPSHVGSDRLVAASSALVKFGSPCVICSFGTALVVDTVNANGEFIGGIIAPGPGLMAEALHTKTALLPRIKVNRPEKLIGQTTPGAMASGIYYGSIAMAEGLISRVLSEMYNGSARHVKPKVVATGGFGKILAGEVPQIDIYDENLTLDGLRMIADRINSPFKQRS